MFSPNAGQECEGKKI